MRFSPGWAAAYEERELRRTLQREKALNAVIEARNPCLRPAPRYQERPLPTATFYTEAQALRYQVRREMGKHNPTIVYKTAGSAPRGGSCRCTR